MTPLAHSPREDALAIWHAGLAAVDSRRLVRQAIFSASSMLVVAGEEIALSGIRRITVVGGGKAGAGMAAGLLEALGDEIIASKEVTGWVNVPSDCVIPLQRIHLHPARPPGCNEPTPEAVEGARRIMELVGQLRRDDLCICLLSGGGSALLPLPVPEITLEDKQAVTRHLSAAGATIGELNTVRKRLSLIKGGGLLRACAAGRLITLIISDVMGDPLPVIASGPTVEAPGSFSEALAVLDRYDPGRRVIPKRVYTFLERGREPPPAGGKCRASHCIIGNNATAVAAAVNEAERLGYACSRDPTGSGDGFAEEVGRRFADAARTMASAPPPRGCLVSGGEPVVRLVPEASRGLGGRNQQLVLAAAIALWNDPPGEFAILSGGTDGEDGPTDAAGAYLTSDVLVAAKLRGLDPAHFLARNDAYHFFDPVGALIKTGPTQTNVCDLRVVLARGRAG